MAKRFIDTNVFRKSFIRGLSAPQKLLWIYIICDCSHAGIWEVDLEVASIFTGIKISLKDLEKFENHIVFFDDKKKVFIPDFIEFQYGKLKENNNTHISVIKELSKYNLINSNFELINYQIVEPLGRGLSAPMYKDKDKDKDIDKDKDNITWKNSFEIYKDQLRIAWKEIVTKEYIEEREKFHPGLDIKLTLEKACKDFWSMEAGWKNKKQARIKEIDWKATFNNSLSNKVNQVWKNQKIISNIM